MDKEIIKNINEATKELEQDNVLYEILDPICTKIDELKFCIQEIIRKRGKEPIGYLQQKLSEITYELKGGTEFYAYFDEKHGFERYVRVFEDKNRRDRDKFYCEESGRWLSIKRFGLDFYERFGGK